MTIQSMFTVEGMTLKDWFAGQALAARISSSDIKPEELHNHAKLAAWAYTMAQAMMEHRDRMQFEAEEAMWGPESGTEPPKNPQGG
jgi:hypothetical protein